MALQTTWTAPPALEKQRLRSISLVLLAAFLVQAMVLFVVLPNLGDLVSPEYGVGFGDLYDQIANNLMQGKGYRIEPNLGETMMREPGYPLFLVCVFKVGGYHIEAARLANLLLAVGIAFMMMRLARRVTNDRAAALIATLLFLFYPGILIAEARGGVEIAFIFVVMLFMLALHDAVEKGHIWRYLVAGSLLGVVVLVRSTPLLFPVFLLAFLMLTTSGAGERLKLVFRIALLVLAMVAVMSPWIIRNYMLVHEVVPTATVAGIAAQEGQYTCQNLSFDSNFRTSQREAAHERNQVASQMGVPFEGWYYQYFYTPRDEQQFNQLLLHRAAGEYGKHPALLAQCVGKNLVNIWFLGKTWRATLLNAAMQVPLLGLALSGVYLLWKRGGLRKLGIILMFVLYIIAVQVPIIAHARHSIPLVPFLAILAGVSLVSIWQRVARRGWRTGHGGVLSVL